MAKYIQITSIRLTQDEMTTLRKMSENLGLFQLRGAGAGKIGSISRLMKAIAKGEIKISEYRYK